MKQNSKITVGTNEG